MNKCLLIPDWEPIIDPSTDISEVHFAELMHFIGVIYSNIGAIYSISFTVIGVTYRNRSELKIAASPKPL